MADATSKINDLYDKALASERVGIDAQYKQSLSDQEYAKSQIDPTYRRASNDLATQYERNRRNLNMQAMVNGLNTGTGSQQQLALNNVWTKNYASLQGERANAIAAADKAIADLKNQYQAAIAQATAENDYKRAAALLDEYNRTRGGGGGGYSRYSGPATGGGYNLNADIDKMIAEGKDPAAINDAISRMVSAGQLDVSAARAGMDYNQSKNTNKGRMTSDR